MGQGFPLPTSPSLQCPKDSLVLFVTLCACGEPTNLSLLEEEAPRDISSQTNELLP